MFMSYNSCTLEYCPFQSLSYIFMPLGDLASLVFYVSPRLCNRGLDQWMERLNMSLSDRHLAHMFSVIVAGDVSTMPRDEWRRYDIPYLFPFSPIGLITYMMTSSNGNIFRVTGHLCGEFTGPRWIPHTKASDAELWCLLWSAPE